MLSEETSFFYNDSFVNKRILDHLHSQCWLDERRPRSSCACSGVDTLKFSICMFHVGVDTIYTCFIFRLAQSIWGLKRSMLWNAWLSKACNTIYICFVCMWVGTIHIYVALECVIIKSLQLNQAGRHQNMRSKWRPQSMFAPCTSNPFSDLQSILIHHCSTCTTLVPPD